MKPIILITSYFVDKSELKDKEKRVRGAKEQDLDICSMDYVNAVHLAGGTPLIMANIDDEEYAAAMLELADGILFSGGEDVHPKYYNEAVDVNNMFIVDQRDSFEMKLAKGALESGKPLLGICRGMQLLNVAAGGTLYQDIDEMLDTSIKHSNSGATKHLIMHEINLVKDSKLFEIYKSEKNGVNSFHHQAVKVLADCYKPSAHAEDGLLEAYELEGERFLMAIQWHPEMMFQEHPHEHEIFKHFVQKAQEYKIRK